MKRRLSPTVIVAIFFVLFDSVVFYGAYVKRKVETQAVYLSAPAPEFKWTGFDGKTHGIKELEGHVVVLHFWASWCPPCREEFPKMLQAANDNRDVIFLTVSSDDNREKPEQFIQMAPRVSGIEASPNVLYAWDPARTLTYDEFLTVAYPETIIIDAHQRLRRKFPTPVNWASASIRDYLKELKTEK